MDQTDDFEKAVLFSFDQSGAVDDHLKVSAVDLTRKLGQHLSLRVQHPKAMAGIRNVPGQVACLTYTHLELEAVCPV